MKPIKVGQIGIGHNHGEGKMNALRKFPELFEVVGVCEPEEDWRKKRGDLEVYRGLPFLSEEELLSKVDAVAVETDVWNLGATAQRCIDAGKHIHMDKPAGEDYAAYQKLLGDAERKNLTVQLGYMYRYNPSVKKCMEMVEKGELGTIFQINAEMSTHHSAEYRRWLQHFQGGTMYIFGCHLIDLIVKMLGEPEEVIPFLKHTGFDEVDVADNDTAILIYPQGIARVTTVSTELNGWGRRQLVVCGEKGTVEIKPLELPVHFTLANDEICTNAYADQKKELVMADVPQLCRYDRMVQEWAACIRGEKENPYSFAHELALQRTLLKACGVSFEK